MPTGLGDEKLWISATNDNTGTSTAFDDLSGEGNDGTANGGLLVVADTSNGGSYCFDFDGVDDYIDVVSSGVPAAAYSVSLWQYSTKSQVNILFNAGDSNGQRNVNSDGIRSGTFGDSHGHTTSSGNTWVANPDNRSGSTWYHHVLTYDGSVLRLYVNGVLANSRTSVGNTNVTETMCYIGKYIGGAFQFQGRADDIRTYGRALTQAEITHLTSSRGVEGPAPVGLGDEQVWLCPSLSDNANDISGNGNNGTYQGGMGTIVDTSNGGSLAYDFDGTDDRIDCPSTVLGGSQVFSMACWVYVNSHDATYGEGFMGQFNTSTNNTGLVYAGRATSFRGLVNAGGTNYTSSATGSSPPTGAWHHLVSVVDGSNITLYVDGVSQGSTAYSGAITSTPSGPFEIGRYDGSGAVSNRHCLDGKMDDVRAYHRAITSAEITHLATSRGIEGSPSTPPATGFYNPFINKIFFNDYTRRIR